MDTEYDILVRLYLKANEICDPIDFQKRQKDLLKYLSEFIIERYQTQENEKEDDDD